MLYPIELRARWNIAARLAERRGFEPPDRFYPTNRLAGGCLQPLGHLSKTVLAEGVGFEPTELSLSGFQDRRLKPLGHPSTYISDCDLGWIAVRLKDAAGYPAGYPSSPSALANLSASAWTATSDSRAYRCVVTIVACPRIC